MSNLTDAQEKAYAGEIKALLEEYKSDMLAADPPVDPTSRITSLTNSAKATEDAEAAQVKTLPPTRPPSTSRTPCAKAFTTRPKPASASRKAPSARSTPPW